ncbi:MAG: A/G-specific adenine glycosylase, partial [Gemmatimonadota bacterium]
DDDPYRIWVSEVMLQQTRVDTVVPYYRRWIERFPSLDDLAAADQEEVLQLWKGLGYYSRARNLHRAARMVRERHGGSVPDTVEGLKTLPGVGEYTAGAVASIAFHRAEPAVDGNVRRVLSRLYDLADPGDAHLRRKAGSLVDPKRPGCFNQALMELGATVCTPTAPACARCPLEQLCLARARGTVEERPRPRKRSSVAGKSVVVGIPVSSDGRTLLVRRPEDGLLGGLWEFPSMEVPEEDDGGGADAEGEPGEGAPDRARFAHEALETRGVVPTEDPPIRLGTLPHTFSHLRVTYDLFLFREARLEGISLRPGDEPAPDASSEGSALEVGARVRGDGDRNRRCPAAEASAEDRPDFREVRIVALDDLDGVPLPVAQQKIGRLAREVLGEGRER